MPGYNYLPCALRFEGAMNADSGLGIAVACQGSTKLISSMGEVGGGMELELGRFRR